MKILIKVSETGRRVGDNNARARVPDALVDTLRDLNELGLGSRRLAYLYGLPRSSVAAILNYSRRNTAPRGHVVRIIGGKYDQ